MAESLKLEETCEKNNKLFLIIIMICIMINSYQPICADDGYSTSTSTPYNDYIKYTSVSLTKEDGEANCTASITSYSSVTNVSIYIQKYENGTQWHPFMTAVHSILLL